MCKVKFNRIEWEIVGATLAWGSNPMSREIDKSNTYLEEIKMRAKEQGLRGKKLRKLLKKCQK